MRRAPLLLLVALAGCDSGLALTVDIQAPCRAGATTLHASARFQPSGRTGEVSVDASTFFAGAHRIGVVPPGGTRLVEMTVQLLDGAGDSLVAATTDFALPDRGAVSGPMVLDTCRGDGGGSDGAVADLVASGPTDLAAGDRSSSADLAAADLSCVSGPARCSTGTDAGSGTEYVVCGSECSHLWLTQQGGGGRFHAIAICKSLGYLSLLAIAFDAGAQCSGQTLGDLATTTCQNPGAQPVGLMPPTGSDADGPYWDGNVSWVCGK